MKKLFLTAITTVIAYSAIQAQATYPLDVFDNVDLGSTGMTSMHGMYGNWGVSSGTAVYAPSPSWIQTSTSSTVEGSIFRRYYFKPNTNYKVVVGIDFFGTGFPGTNPEYKFNVILANGVTGTTSIGNPAFVPVFSATRFLYTYTVSNYGSISTNGASLSNQALMLQFTTGPSENYDGIVFFTQGNEEVRIGVGCLGIYSCPVTANDINDNSTLIPSGVSTGKNAYIGSSYGSSASMTSSDPNATTGIYATQAISVAQNTTLTANSNNYVDLVIRNDCFTEFVTYSGGTVFSQMSPSSCDMPSRTIPAQASVIKASERSVLVFPNPAQDHQFTVKNVSDETVQLEFIDLSGRSIDRRSVEKNSSSSYSLQNLASGVYYLKVSGSNYNKVEKILLN